MAAKTQINDSEACSPFWRSRIGQQLLIAILAFSSIVTLVVTASDLYIEYRAGIATIQERFHQIERSYASSLGESLWDLNKRQIELQLQGILDLPDIHFVQISEVNRASPVHFSMAIEGPPAKTAEQRDIPLPCLCGETPRIVGVLHLEATYDNIYRDLLRRTLMILAGQGIKTFLVATFILFIVHQLVTRDLLSIAGEISRFAPGEGIALHLRRDRRRHDEFKDLVTAFNSLGDRLARREKDVTAANARMAAILDNIPDLAWVKDTESRYIAANRPLARVLGLSDPNEVIGKTDFDLSPREIAEGYRRDDIEVMRSGVRKRTDESHFRADGAPFQIETIKGPLRDANGIIVGTVGIARDVSERNAAEQALRETATRLEALIANTEATVFRASYSVLGPRLTMAVYGGPAANGTMALDDYRQTIHPDDRSRELDTIGEEFVHSDQLSRTCRILGPDGDPRWALVRERVVGREGGTIVTEGLAVDITEETETRRRLESIIKNLPGSIFRFRYPETGIKQMEFYDGRIARTRPFDPTTSPPEVYTELFHPDDRQALFVDLPRRLRETDEVVHIFRVKDNSGAYRWMRAWEHVVERNGGDIVTEGIALDVTDEMVAKQALEASEQEFRTLAENSPNLIMRYDRDYRRTYVNPAYERATANPGSKAINLTPDAQWVNVDSPVDPYKGKLQEVMDTGAAQQIVLRWTRADGASVTHAVQLVPDRDPAGHINGVLAIGHDITLLKATESQLQALIDNLPGRTYRITVLPNGQRRLVFTGGSGLDLAELLIDENHWLAPDEAAPHVHPDDAQHVLVDMLRQLSEHDSFRLRYRLALPDESIRWVMSHGRVVKRADDETVIEGMLLDVTAEMVAKMALEASERRYRELVDALPVGVFEDEPDTGCVYASDLWTTLTGLPFEQIKGYGWTKAIHPDDLARVEAQWGADVAARALHRNEFRLRHLDGTVTWVLVRALPRLDANGGLRGYIGSVTDISERKQMEVALRASEESFRTLAENMPDMVVRLDKDTRFLYVTPLVCRVHGKPLDQIIGKTLAELVTPRMTHQQEELSAAIRRAFEEGQPNALEVRWETPEGDVYTDVRHIPERNEAGDVVSILGISRDITKQKQAETELRETAHALESLIANLPATVFRYHYPASGLKKLTMMDGAAVRELGTLAEVLLAMGPEEYRGLYLPEDHHWLFEEIPAQLRKSGQVQFTHRMILPDGTLRWTRAWERVVERNGDEMVTEGISLDVTEEIEAKRSFELSEQHFTDLVAAVPVGVFEDDLVTGCVFTSSLWSELTGLPAEGLMGTGWQIPIVADDLARIRTAWSACVERQAVFEAEYRLRHVVTGAETWVLARAMPRLDHDGKLVGYIGSITDIGERKAYEVSLERINRTLRTVASGNEVLMMQADEETLFQKMCEVIVETGGYAMAWVGLADHDKMKTVRPVASAGDTHDYIGTARVRWDGSPRGRGPTGAAIRTGRPQVNNDMATNPSMVPWRAKALACGYRSNVALPLKGDGGAIGCLTIYSTAAQGFAEKEVAILVDFSNNIAMTVLAMRERRRREEIERHLHQAQKMEALGLLASTVAHDFNNLLGAIQGFAGFIVEDASEDDKAGYYGQRILTAGKRGKALIGQILAFSRKVDMKRDRFSLADMLTETKTLLTASIPQSTSLSIIAEPCPCTVIGDRDLLGEALINLCMNAQDAIGSAPGIITIHLRPTDRNRLEGAPILADDMKAWVDDSGRGHTVSGKIDGSRPCVSLVVADDGAGMDCAVLERIFTPFFTTKQKGTGLGLAAVQRIVTAHQGAIVVDSLIGQGATFEIILPCDAADDVASASPAPASPRTKAATGRILLVDDDPDFGDMLLTALERRGFEVSPCSDPAEALAGLEEFPTAWDAMVTDQTMPNMSGLELIQAARAFQPDLACILCTGYAEDVLDTTTLAGAGVDALFRKPVDIDHLVDHLSQCCQQES